MQRMIALVFAGLCLTAPGCRQKAYPKAPYARASAPALETLLLATAPRFSKLRVPKAKVREGRSPGARLLLLAEAPARMLGTIQVAGNPLLSLALNEQAYGLRTVRDTPALKSGFYEGPPSRCAVASLLGVDLESEQVVALLLGGGPLIDGPHELVDQGWHKGRERVVIRNARYEQVLDFAWVDGSWWFAGARLYALGGAKPQWLWTIEHAALEGSGAKVLPTKTKIRRPNGPKDKIELTISYAKQVATPFATAEGGGEGEDGGDSDAEESGDPGWTDEGWDDDDEGWEGDEVPQEGSAPEPEPEPEPQPEPEPEPEAIPAAYILQANGLPNRGDLCRR